MMKRCISITFNVDPKEYHRARDSAEGCVSLAIAMLRREADLPESVTVNCEGQTKKINPNK